LFPGLSAAAGNFHTGFGAGSAYTGIVQLADSSHVHQIGIGLSAPEQICGFNAAKSLTIILFKC
jgi:hypothetical protein